MIAGSGVVLGAAYLLWLYQRTILGEVTNEKNRNLKDMNWREMAYMAPLIIWAFWIGLYPKPFFDILDKPVATIVERVNGPSNGQQAGCDTGAGTVPRPFRIMAGNKRRDEPVLHADRPLGPAAGADARALRLRRFAVRFRRSSKAESSANTCAVLAGGAGLYRDRALSGRVYLPTDGRRRGLRVSRLAGHRPVFAVLQLAFPRGHALVICVSYRWTLMNEEREGDHLASGSG